VETSVFWICKPVLISMKNLFLSLVVVSIFPISVVFVLWEFLSVTCLSRCEVLFLVAHF
jgi:hypothetical protein